MRLIKYTVGDSKTEVLVESIAFESALQVVSKIIDTSKMNSWRDPDYENTWCFGYNNEIICKLAIVE